MSREFYVISVMHTIRQHRYITLWGPDDKGYYFRTLRSGRYPEERVRARLTYYNGGSNIAVPCDVIDPMTVMTTPADCFDGPDGSALLNTRANWKILIANAIETPQYPPEPEFPGSRRRQA